MKNDIFCVRMGQIGVVFLDLGITMNFSNVFWGCLAMEILIIFIHRLPARLLYIVLILSRIRSFPDTFSPGSSLDSSLSFNVTPVKDSEPLFLPVESPKLTL